MVGKGYTMSDEELSFCYYCFDPIDASHPNVSPQPCHCKGSITLHDQCYKTYVYKQGRCGICKQKFPRPQPFLYSQPHNVYYKYDGTTIQKYEDSFLRYTWTTNGYGTYIEYHNNGEIYKHIETYRRGTFLGKYHGFVKNTIQGHFQKFYENGQCKVDCYYEENKLHGPYQEYANDGQILEDLVYEHGQLHGLCTWWKGPHRIKQVRYYEKGIPMKRKHRPSLDVSA